MARGPQKDLHLPVSAHSSEHELAAHPYKHAHESPIFEYPCGTRSRWEWWGRMALAGALFVKGVGDVLKVPGRPRVIATPGQTHGHVALHLPERDAVITTDGGQALASLNAIAETGARQVLPGHGNPWGRGAARAVESARRNGMK